MSETTPQEDSPPPNESALVPATSSTPATPAAASVTLTMRSTREFPADPSPLSREQLENHYRLMRSSHSSLSRSRGQLLRRSKEFSLARQRFLETLRTYEERLSAIGLEKVEAMELAQELHRELEAFEGKQQALDRILSELDEAKEEAGFWAIFRIRELIEKMRRLLRGGDGPDRREQDNDG